MSLLGNFEHVFAVAAQDIVKFSKFVENKVLPALRETNSNAATIQSITALVSPQAANIERVGFSVLGLVIKTIQDAEAAGAAGGINLTLDSALIADIKSIIPAIKQQSSLSINAVTPSGK